MVSFRPSRTALVVSLISMLVGFGGLTDAQAAPKQKKTTSKVASPVVAAATQYVNAMASGDKVGVGRLDFACLYRMVEAAPKGLTRPLPENDPVYAACWTPIAA